LLKPAHQGQPISLPSLPCPCSDRAAIHRGSFHRNHLAPTRAWWPKRGARALASPHLLHCLSPASSPTRLAIMSVVFTGPVDFAATDGVQTETVSSLVGSRVLAPHNRRAPRCTKRTGLLSRAGRVMPQRARSYRNQVSRGSDGSARRTHAWIVDSRPSKKRGSPVLASATCGTLEASVVRGVHHEQKKVPCIFSSSLIQWFLDYTSIQITAVRQQT